MDQTGTSHHDDHLVSGQEASSMLLKVISYINSQPQLSHLCVLLHQVLASLDDFIQKHEQQGYVHSQSGSPFDTEFDAETGIQANTGYDQSITLADTQTGTLQYTDECASDTSSDSSKAGDFTSEYDLMGDTDCKFPLNHPVDHMGYCKRLDENSLPDVFRMNDDSDCDDIKPEDPEDSLWRFEEATIMTEGLLSDVLPKTLFKNTEMGMQIVHHGGYSEHAEADIKHEIMDDPSLEENLDTVDGNLDKSDGNLSAGFGTLSDTSSIPRQKKNKTKQKRKKVVPFKKRVILTLPPTLQVDQKDVVDNAEPAEVNLSDRPRRTCRTTGMLKYKDFHMDDDYEEQEKNCVDEYSLTSSKGPYRFKCTLCDQVFRKKCEVLKHFNDKELHSEKNLCECIICGFRVYHFHIFKEHMAQHIEAEPCSDAYHFVFHFFTKLDGKAKHYLCQVCRRTYAFDSKKYKSRQLGDLPHDMFSHVTNTLIPMEEMKQRCEFCNNVVLCVQYQDHLQAEHEFKCDKCDGIFRTNEDMQKHKELTKACRSPIRCEICKKVFRHRTFFEKHKLTHLYKKKFQCNICKQEFSSSRNLSLHGWVHKPGFKRPFQCVQCERNYVSKSQLKRHLELYHLKARPLKCEICGQWLSKYTIKGHVRKVHGPKTFVCNLCGKGFKSKFHLDQHSATHLGKSHICKLCGQAFLQSCNLRYHMNKHTGQKPYSCMCGKEFHGADQLAVHRSSCDNNDDKFQCDTCHKHFRNKSLLGYHKNRHMGLEPFKCDHCERVFASPMARTQHTSHHHDKTRYQCDECGKCFKDNHFLNYHMNRHRGLTPYKCRFCNESFSSPTLSYIHKRRHHDHTRAENLNIKEEDQEQTLGLSQ